MKLIEIEMGRWVKDNVRYNIRPDVGQTPAQVKIEAESAGYVLNPLTPEEMENVRKDRELTAAKRQKKHDVANARFKEETAGCELNGIHVATDRDSQSMIMGALQLSIIDPTKIIKWKTINGFVELNAQMIQGVAMAVCSHVESMFTKESVKCAEIDAATTVEAVNAIEW